MILQSSFLNMGSPPLARGKVVTTITASGNERITPACAGKSGLGYTSLCMRWDHPRLRGEKIFIHLNHWRAQGSPPLARGKERKTKEKPTCFGITPACAGKREGMFDCEDVIRDHPRLRGEKLKSLMRFRRRMGSPPLARGKGFCRSPSSGKPRITPACAGKRLLCPRFGSLSRDHPRLRGEKYLLYLLSMPSKGSPPLARGKAKGNELLLIFVRITPACAGKSSFLLFGFCFCWDHPRLRGEKPK